MIDKSKTTAGRGDQTSLVSWVTGHCAEWEQHRKSTYDRRWGEYYRLWRGEWDGADKLRQSERSKLINPALSQAVEATVAELEEAAFGNGKWFDVDDNFTDEDPTDIAIWRDQFNEDLNKEKVPEAIREIFLNGALYGTGIGKVVLKEREDKSVEAQVIGDTDVTRIGVSTDNTVRVGLIAIPPTEFVIDPAGRTIDDALGVAHITQVPKHSVEEKIADGSYQKVDLTASSNNSILGTEIDKKRSAPMDASQTLITEYHGLVPKHLLEEAQKGKDTNQDLYAVDEGDATPRSDELVEAIVTIANGSQLLRCVANPYTMGDRCFVAYQHDTVPNTFWGRGVCEKGYNPQKALDTELRGRIDAMALAIHPMMGIDATRIHRGSKFEVGPGKNILTNGNPAEVLLPFRFGQVDQSTFMQGGDLERQIQMGTGSMDSAAPLGQNRRNETAGGMSMILGGALKRTKRTLANIEKSLTTPFIKKAAWRMMQFAPDRYSVTDMEFVVVSSMGIVARELEQQQLANMMQTVPAESPAFWMLLKGVFENSSLSKREQMLPIIDAMMQKSLQESLNPPEPQQDPMVQVKMAELQVKEKIATMKLQQKEGDDQRDFELELKGLMLEQQEIQIKKQQVVINAQLAMAGQKQDSMVTAMQMGHANRQSQQKLIMDMAKAGGR